MKKRTETFENGDYSVSLTHQYPSGLLQMVAYRQAGDDAKIPFVSKVFGMRNGIKENLINASIVCDLLYGAEFSIAQQVEMFFHMERIAEIMCSRSVAVMVMCIQELQKEKHVIK